MGLRGFKTFGAKESLSESEVALLKRYKVEVPSKLRLEDVRVCGLVFYKGLAPQLDVAGVLAYLERHHSDKLEALTRRSLNVDAFEAAVTAGQLPSTTTAKFYGAPKPQAQFKIS